MKTTWCKIPDEAMERLRSGRLSPREWHVFAVLCSLAHYESRVATTSAAEVAALTGIPRQTVTRILRQLEFLHRWITLHFHKGGNSRYSIEVHFLPQVRKPAFLDEKPKQMSEPEPEMSELNGWSAPEDLPDEESSLIPGARARRREPRVSRESKSKRKSLSPCILTKDAGRERRDETLSSLKKEGSGFASPPSPGGEEASLAAPKKKDGHAPPRATASSPREVRRPQSHAASHRQIAEPAPCPKSGSDGPSSGGETDDAETFRCLRCSDTGLLSYRVKQDGEQPEERQLRCFCQAGAAQNHALPCVDDVFPPQRRQNLRIKLCLGVLRGPDSYLPLVWDEKNDAPVAPAPPWATPRWKPPLDGSVVLNGQVITPAAR